MARDKERSVNPAQQQRKLEKAKALKKGKAELQSRRNEKLARRNPDRLQRQIDDLKALEESGSIKAREKQVLQDLEKDLRAVKKAREALGDKAPKYGNSSHPRRNDAEDGAQRDTVLGKRTRHGEKRHHWDHPQQESSGSETDESVRRIPMPRDTPPPLPRQIRDVQGSGANREPLTSSRIPQGPISGAAMPTLLEQPRTTYESSPQIRNLRKEAVQKFMPRIVRQKGDVVKGAGGLVEPDELDRLEKEGYGGRNTVSTQATEFQVQSTNTTDSGKASGAAQEALAETSLLAEEEERFRREMKHAEVEDVEDEDL